MPIKKVMVNGLSKVPVKIWTNEIEQKAQEQLLNLSKLPFVHSHVAVMPDCHHGKGSTVGTVIATKGAIIPAAVGVDIGCGMQAIKLPFKIDVLGDSLDKLRSDIESVVPVGFHQNENQIEDTYNLFKTLSDNYKIKTEEHEKLLNKAYYQLGSLGGGNHFIEICKDLENNAWIMLHSGSRNIGKSLAEIHIKKAKGIMKQYFVELPDPDLAYFAEKTKEFKSYLSDLMWCQEYAKTNRKEMMNRVLDKVYKFIGNEWSFKPVGDALDCHHNYTQMENHYDENVWITRKGAVSAKKGEYGIIPGSMGTKSYIVRGLGNLESFTSCSHGAGRKMSRNEARKTFTIDDFNQQTAGVECDKKEEFIDEIPGAYKDIETVMDNQSDLVEIVYELKQIMCIKG
jgi:tRNA-splicing ligase RtcB